MENEITFIKILPIHRWEEYKNLKIEAIKDSPDAFTHEISEAVEDPDSKWKESLEECARDEQTIIFAECNGKLIGLAGIYFYKKEKFKHNALLSSLYISPNYRNKGIATELIKKEMEMISLKKNIINVISEIFSSQTASLELHKKLGFKIVGVLKDFVRTEKGYFDCVYLEKKVE